jgi:hypothetical protein
MFLEEVAMCDGPEVLMQVDGDCVMIAGNLL